MKALYCLDIQNQMCVRIPNVRGTGFLVAAMGGHHYNTNSELFSDALKGVGHEEVDTCDIDGYLSIRQNPDVLMTRQQRLTDAQIIQSALQLVFPRITEWVEVTFDVLSSKVPDITP